MSRVMYVPCDDSLLRMPKGVCPRCGSKNFTSKGGVNEHGDPWCDHDCEDCGHLWGWSV